MTNFEISCDPQKQDIETIHNFLTNCYWSKGIDIETVKKAIENSLCFGAFDKNGKQIGFARLITDSATFAYLADVFVLEEFRGKGVSKAIMGAIEKHEVFPKLRRIMLATRDAHGLYEQYGFEMLSPPQINLMMQIVRPDIYSKNTTIIE